MRVENWRGGANRQVQAPSTNLLAVLPVRMQDRQEKAAVTVGWITRRRDG